MSRARSLLLPLFVAATSTSAATNANWQKLSDPTAAEAAALFASPPPEYGAQFTWGWQGPVDREVIARDLDGMKALGVRAAIIEPKTGMTHPYLSPEYFDLVRIAVEEAKQRDMRLWIMDEGDYPSGLAGGKFTVERPDLRMQALAAPEHFAVPAGTTLTRELSPDVIAAVAVDKTDQATKVLDIAGGKVAFAAPTTGDWEVVLTSRIYRTMPTRSANNPANVKDTTHSLMDFLDPTAAALFRQWTFDAYAKAIGDEFGKTVLGFRGDEPAYGFNPWTPKLFDEFTRRKGYDLRPYLAAFAGTPGPRNPNLTDAQRRVYADYCDVWSDLFRDSYFNMEGDWCAAHGLTMQLHIEHEEILPQLATADGDYFKCFRDIAEPGIDIIWHQIWMDNPADFPKLASSAAHLFGRPRAMCEAFAAYQPAPNLKQARWLLDFLMSRGINRIEYMFWSASTQRGNRPPGATGTAASAATSASAAPAVAADGTPQPRRAAGGPRYYRESGFPEVAAYVDRLSYLLGAGRPTAQIGLYIPSSSFWLADATGARRINDSLLALGHSLIEHQRDFDYVDEQALTSVLQLRGAEFVNLSHQGYRAIIVPPALAISQAALAHLRAFAAAGGTVVFIGAPPALVAAKNFLTATGPADITWASLHEANVAITPAVLAALPAPDLALDTPAPLVSYTRRRLRDADVYFIFNSGNEPISLHAVLASSGAARTWDANTGKITPLAGAAPVAGGMRVPLALEPWAATVIMIGGNAPPNIAAN